MSRKSTNKKLKTDNKSIIFIIVIVLVVLFAAHYTYQKIQGNTNNNKNKTSNNTIQGKDLYNDPNRPVHALLRTYQESGDIKTAKLLKKVSSQPESIWLVGPSSSDTSAQRDINEVVRTSSDAAVKQELPVYILYAIPNRDACANYSKGGFTSDEQYLAWIRRIGEALKSATVFVVEPDAVAQTVATNCINAAGKNERYGLLKSAIQELKKYPNTKAVYLDAGNSEWHTDSSILVEPLRKSGIDETRGFSVNVSNFIATNEVIEWSQKLIGQLGGNKGVVIDTSRNGKGIPPSSVTGDARWCNPDGRGLGPQPNTDVNIDYIDAYFWGKKIGESDGNCFGNPPAGTFMPQMTIELARNAIF